MRNYLPHQQQAAVYAASRNKIALFMEMRLGKCIVVIRWAQHRKLERVLLVAPLSTIRGKHQWEGELAQEQVTQVHTLPLVKKRDWDRVLRPRHLVREIVPATRDDGFARRGDTTWSGRYLLRRRHASGWFLVNFEALLHAPHLLAQPWDAIIVDESTRIRNPRAQLTKLLFQTPHVRNKAILSGLPNPESSIDYFAQFKFLHGHFMGYDNYWEFRHAKYHQGYTNWDWQPNRGVRDEIRDYVHNNAFVLLRKTAGVGSDKVRRQVRIQMPSMKPLLKKIRREFAVDEVETKWATVVHIWMQKLASGFHPITHELLHDAKLRALSQQVKQLTGPKVVWFRFNHEIEAAYHYLIHRHPRLRVAFVHGKIVDSKNVRVKHQTDFQDGKLDVLLLQVKLGRYGWNLSRSSASIYFSNSYEFEDRSQSEDRVIHVTKKDPCYYIDLVTVGTTDEDVVEALFDKRITARLFGRRVKVAINKRIRKMFGRAA